MNNYHDEEIKHFSDLSQYWWDISGPLRTLHDINPTRLEFVLNHVDVKEKKLLDVGCGGGIFSESLAMEGALVTAIDLSSEAIKTGIEHAKKQNIYVDYQCIALEDLIEKPARYDVITCMEMLEHVPNPKQIIQSCAALLNPGGQLFVSTINQTWKAYGLAIVAAEQILKFIPENTHQYERFIKPSQIAQWFRESMLEIKTLKGLSYNPFTHLASLTDNLDINYLMCTEK